METGNWQCPGEARRQTTPPESWESGNDPQEWLGAMDSGDEEQMDLLPRYAQLRTYVDGLVGERLLSVSTGPNEAVGALSP